MIRQALSFLFPRKPTLAERLEAERDKARKAYLDALMRETPEISSGLTSLREGDQCVPSGGGDAVNQHTSPWTDAEKATAYKLWDEGQTLSLIAKQLGRSKGGVQGIIFRAEAAGMKFNRPRQEPGKRAAPEQISKAAHLYSVEGLGTDAIGKQVGLGRDYVRTLARRHGWKKPVVVREVKAPKPRAVDDKPRRPPRMETFAPLPFSQPRPWTERGPFMCKWPVGGEGADMIMCCSLASSNRYCEDHAAIAFRSIERKVPTEPSFMRRRAA